MTVEEFTIIATKLWDLLLQAVVTKPHPKPFLFSLKIEQNL